MIPINLNLDQHVDNEEGNLSIAYLFSGKLFKERPRHVNVQNWVTMEGGDLKTLHRQSGGLFGLMGRTLGLGQRELQQQMSDPMKQQMSMQRGVFHWALADLSMVPMLMGKGQEDVIRNQMKTTRELAMQRGSFHYRNSSLRLYRRSKRLSFH